jgi:Protein of unknown function (DUF1501)
MTGRLRDGSLHRREAIQIGLGGMAAALPGLGIASARRPKGRAKSVILLFNSGGIPHHESWDPKPDAPAEIRGPFGSIRTRTPGLIVGELMPRTAQLTDRIAVIRTMVTGDNSHSTSGYQMLTGVPHIPMGRENATPGKPNDWPSINSLVRILRPPVGGLPSSIVLPRRLANFDGLYPWPGVDAGIAGSRYDPWHLLGDPSEANFTAPGCALPDDVPPQRLSARHALLQQVDQRFSKAMPEISETEFDRYRNQALELISGNRARLAFDLGKEPGKVRDRYGRTKHGQSVLLARRLAEAGVSMVQVNWISEDKKRPNGGGWDTHEKHNESIKGWLMPSMDQTYSALLEDLEQRGMLDETLVCWVAEFGHTPRFNTRLGRDHWGRVFSIALAGAGIRGGVVHGASDRLGAEPRGDVVRPCDYLATVFHCMGYAADTPYQDVEGRPLPISRGRVIESVLA